MFLTIVEHESDRTFLRNLYEENYETMYRKALSMLSDASAAEDVIQDTFVYFARNLDKIYKVPCNSLPFYIVMCIKRRCIDYIRKQHIRKQHIVGSTDDDVFSFEYPDTNASVEDQALLKLDAEAVQSTFKELPERIQDVLRYKYLLGMNDHEIAKLLGVKEGSVRSYILRAKREVYRICEEKGYVG